MRRTLKDSEGAEDGEEDGEPRPPRKRGDPVPIALNEFGEPIVPDISALPKSAKAHRYLPDLIRSVMRHDYGADSRFSMDPKVLTPSSQRALGTSL